ncbi:aminodeoxychorismate lyase [Shewanella sp. 202IG2-18]|uniref:aminodeoxychorismate lyase n=1 Tax=Parashewanella hymeniacidonis TaxID=2807618 RepID=UPI001960CA59|nr:aminodeoxychorismate lyase [Parashewanella hymeniacidonis]MBM7074035.1 aminodeoxychorismate lyase [Parashewanella hymeniacidonis]
MENIWINGQQGKLIDVSDRGLNYGDGLFLTMRVNQEGQILFFNSHISRIEQAVIRLNIKNETGFWQLPTSQKILLEIIAEANPNRGIKLLISRGSGGRGYSALNCTNITTVITIFDFPTNYQKLQQTGLNLTLSDIRLAQQPKLSGMKHLNRLEQVLIKSQLLPNGFQDWLVTDNDNQIIESSMANLFFYLDDKWYTPSLCNSGVAGVMRERVIYALLDLGFNVEVSDVGIEALNKIEHIFMTNSLMGVVDVKQVDQHCFEAWDSTSMLNNLLGVQL